MDIGINRRLSRLMGSGSSILLPLDGALIDGPLGGTRKISNLLTPKLLEEIDCILGYVGLLKRLPPAALGVPFIVNLSASTVLGQPTRKVKIGDVRQAVSYGADGVCFQLHMTDEFEFSMLQDTSHVIAEAGSFGMPVLVTVYPRRLFDGKVCNYSEMYSERPSEYLELACHCVRVAVELGADIVKTAYPGSGDGVEAIVEAALGVPVLFAGGKPVAPDIAIEKAAQAVRHGAKGVAFGRQLFLDPSPELFVSKLRAKLTLI